MSGKARTCKGETIACFLEVEKKSIVCREFGISLFTVYKIFNCYQDCGLDALSDRSRRRYRHAHECIFEVRFVLVCVFFVFF